MSQDDANLLPQVDEALEHLVSESQCLGTKRGSWKAVVRADLRTNWKMMRVPPVRART